MSNNYNDKTPTKQACAACKHQRKKCTQECPLAPYFPLDQEQHFNNAHKLFGVKNILKTIKGLDQQQKHNAMSSIIYESNARAVDPVGGCHHIILRLQRKLQLKEVELEMVKQQLKFLKRPVVGGQQGLDLGQQCCGSSGLIFPTLPSDGVNDPMFLKGSQDLLQSRVAAQEDVMPTQENQENIAEDYYDSPLKMRRI